MQSGLIRLLIDKPSQIRRSYHGKRTLDPKALRWLLSRSQGASWTVQRPCGRTSKPRPGSPSRLMPGSAPSRCRASAARPRLCCCAKARPITSMPISTGSWRGICLIPRSRDAVPRCCVQGAQPPMVLDAAVRRRRARRGRRFNCRGIPALYTSLAPLTTIREAEPLGSVRPTCHPLRVRGRFRAVFDTRDEARRAALDVNRNLRALFGKRKCLKE